MASRSFIAGYTVAQIGAYIAFVPLLQILVPLQAARIAPAHPAALLSLVAMAGAISASIANLVAGALSDRTAVAGGRRRSWLIGGLVATVLSYGAVARATTPTGLAMAVIGFQIAFNVMFAPLVALFADRIPDRQKGLVSACIGLGYPLGSVIGTTVVGAMLTGAASRYGAVAILVMVTMLPFALALRETAPPPRARSRTPPTADFVVALLGRLLVITALTLMQTYLLLFLDHLERHGGILHRPPEAALARLIAIATVANLVGAICAGWLSDRLRRRRLFVFAGAALIGCGIAATALSVSWPALQAASLIYGCGCGIYYAVDLALLAQLLPSTDHAGRGFGIVNLANTVPQIVAPLLGLRLLHGAASGYPALLAIAAAAALFGGALTLLIRTAR